jgi:Lipase (class 3)
LASAKRLFYQVRRIVEEHVVHSDCCQLIITGHSLGASAGCLLAMMLRSRYPELVMAKRIQVYAFGPPPVLDYDSAIGASTYVTSVVNQCDIIPRCSLANLEIFLEVLRQVSLDILVSKDIAPTSLQTTSAFLQQLSNDKGGSLWSREELSKAIQTALSMVEVRNPNHLYVPGKLLYMSHDGLQSEPLDDEIKRYSYQVTDGAAASLRIVTMNGYQMLGDHTTASYFEAIESLIQNQHND